MERQLTRIWENVLGVHPIGIEDKFFDLGGHSLLAVRVIGQIEKAFGKKLRLATIFQAPTIEQLAAILREEIKESSITAVSSLVEIQAQGTRPPLFLVHGAGGGMFWGYVNLSRCLGPNQPVYGFKSRGLDGEEEYGSIKEMAAHYVADLRLMQPHGPYYLGGYCFGGNVAFEMARQLAEQGQPVALLALLNCAPPNSRYTRIPWTPLWGWRLLRNLLYWGNYFRHWSPTQRREFFRWKWSLLKKKLGSLGGAAHRDLSRLDAGDLVDLSAYTEEQRKVWAAHVHSLLDYHPEPFPGRVHLFRSPGHPLWCSFDPDYGWGDLAKGSVEIIIVPGAHEKILEEPCVQVLARHLDQALCDHQKAQAPTVTSREPEESEPELKPTERQLLAQWNQTRADFPVNATYAQPFEAQVERSPTAIAVRYDGKELTYAELNGHANQLARRLQGHGVKPGVLVGVCLPRSLDLMVALLAVLKAGGAYLPLDRSYPKERLAYMLADSQARLLLTQRALVSELPKGVPIVLCVDAPQEQAQINRCSAANLVSEATPDSLAYVIYTSGSTGMPKGVPITHRSLLNHNFAIL
ncbi:MAG TPA: AMP-binding protein, partial [Candidatus Sulfotelmatobacter sp.]|nr:AMP-binding protein [Candidatus Sulfotelmatobacter sp.]